MSTFKIIKPHSQSIKIEKKIHQTFFSLSYFTLPALEILHCLVVINKLTSIVPLTTRFKSWLGWPFFYKYSAHHSSGMILIIVKHFVGTWQKLFESLMISEYVCLARTSWFRNPKLLPGPQEIKKNWMA